jgi:hypothetical protein
VEKCKICNRRKGKEYLNGLCSECNVIKARIAQVISDEFSNIDRHEYSTTNKFKTKIIESVLEDYEY